MLMQHAKLSVPVTEIVHRAVAEFCSRSSAKPRFIYLPRGLFNDVEDAIVTEIERLSFGLAHRGNITVTEYLGCIVRRSPDSNIHVTEVPL